MWEGEQTTEIAEMPAQNVHERERDTAEHEHQMVVEKHEAGVNLALEEE